jgi:hypothetical protein
MTRNQLERFVSIRNKSRFSSNLQFSFDAKQAGFNAKDLGDPVKLGEGHYTWQTPHGVLTEFAGRLSLS